MNPTAAQELLDLIMLDDFVARRAALDRWCRRWLMTAVLRLQDNAPLDSKMRDAAVADELLVGLLNAKGVAVKIETTPDEFHKDIYNTRATMHVVRQTPLEGV